MKHLFFLFFFLVVANIASSQKYNFTGTAFIQHLIDIGEFEDAVYVIEKQLPDTISLSLADSLNYFAGWSYYSLKKLPESGNRFLKVSDHSPFYFKSRFFAGYNFAHLGNAPGAFNIFDQIKPQNQLLTDMKYFELAGTSLLSRDLQSFKRFYSMIEKSELFVIAQEKESFQKFHSEISSFEKKSPFLGGIMSAIIPGAGKIYAGKTGEGIAALIIVSSMGLTTMENYRKEGIRNTKTLIFGSIFTILYVGNIYGSVFTVKLANDEFNHEMDNKILFNMHIPLRNIFN